MPEFKRLSKLHKYGAAISFLAMEIFALIAFSFGDNFVIYGSISLALLVLLIIFNIAEIKIEGVSSIALFFLPLFLFTVITAFGVYSRSHAYRGDYSTAELVFIPLGLLPMSFSGYLLSIDKNFKISTFLVVIYTALGVLSLVNLTVNLVNFGAFYTVLYKGYHMYYGGVMSEVTVDQMAYTLEGLKFIEVKMAHYVLYPALLLTSSAALLFLSPKQEKRMFVIYCVFVFISALSLILVPSKLGLELVILIGLIDLVIFLLKRFNALRKPASYVLTVVLVLGALGFLFIVLNNQSAIPFVHNLTSGNSFLNRLFNSNRYALKYNPLVTDVFSGDKFLGFAVNNMIQQEEVHMTGSFLFDFFMTSGVIGVIAFIFALVIGFKGFKKYFVNCDEKFYIKAVLITFVVFYIIFIGYFSDNEYGIYYSIFKPVYMTGPFMLMVFIFSYVLAKGGIKKEKKEEMVSSEEVQAEEVTVNE